VFKLSYVSYLMIFWIFISVTITIACLTFIVNCIVSKILIYFFNKQTSTIFNIICSVLGAVCVALISFVTPTLEGSSDAQIINFVGEINTIYNGTLFINWAGNIPTKSLLLLDSSYYIYILYGAIGFILTLVIAFLFSKYLYINGRKTFSFRSKKNLTRNDIENIVTKKFSHNKNKYLSYLKRETSLLKSNISIVTSSILISLSAPISILINVYMFFQTREDYGNLYMFLMTTFYVLCLFNPLSSFFSLSIEGRNIYMIKSMPINYKYYCFSKSFYGTCYSLLLAIICYICFACLNTFTIVESISLLVLGVTYSIFNSFCSLGFGFRFPKFNLDGETIGVSVNRYNNRTLLRSGGR